MKPLYKVVETQQEDANGEEPADQAISSDIDGCSYTCCIDNVFWYVQFDMLHNEICNGTFRLPAAHQ
jgi:hypothetical protein